MTLDAIMERRSMFIVNLTNKESKTSSRKIPNCYIYIKHHVSQQCTLSNGHRGFRFEVSVAFLVL